MSEDKKIFGVSASVFKNASQSIFKSIGNALSTIEDKIASLDEKVQSIKLPPKQKWCGEEAMKLRIENTHGVPEHSGDRVGRLIFNTLDESVHVDAGHTFKRVSLHKMEMDFKVHDVLEKIVIDVSASQIEDARRALWQLRDNMNDFEIIGAEIKTPNEKTVIIILNPGSSVGTYRLIGIE